MDIVMNEIKCAKDALETHDLGKYPTSTLTYLAKYYREYGNGWNDITDRLGKFILECDSSVSLVKWEPRIRKAISAAKKYPPIVIPEIVVTKPEMEAISKIKGMCPRRLAFTLLCLSKYYDKMANNESHWVFMPHSDIMRIANIKQSVARQCEMIRQLKTEGYIDTDKRVDRNNIKVLFNNDGESAVSITDFRNLGYQYMLSIGDVKYFKCANCGITERYIYKEVGRKQI